MKRTSGGLGTILLTLAGLVGLGLQASAAELTVEKDSEGVTVNVDGKLFTRYLVKSGAKPILWPIVGPTGKEMTRAWPMREGNPDEKLDHVHQRSFWFTHGAVNKVSFWDENKGHGDINHREFVKVEGGKGGNTAIIVTRNDWVGPDGAKICEDQRTLVFGADADARWIDFDAVVTAGASPAVFGDTKEGAFGLRVAGTMNVDKKLGGRIINSRGLADDAAWGKPAEWVDYNGPVQDEQLGVAIMNHPSSFRFPSHWHVRTYGLFAANPFGLRDFSGDKNIDGAHTIEPGKTMVLRYRVVFHKGTEATGKIAERFAEYAKVAK